MIECESSSIEGGNIEHTEIYIFIREVKRQLPKVCGFCEAFRITTYRSPGPCEGFCQDEMRPGYFSENKPACEAIR